MNATDDLRRELDGLPPYQPNGRGDHGKTDGEPSGEQTRTPEPIRTIRFAGLKGRTPPARRFIVEHLVPARCVTSLYGDGGIGKTLLTQLLGTAAAVGRDLFGFKVEKGAVLGLMCEDDDDELWRRQVRINEYLACDMDDLDGLHLQGRAGLENTLVSYPNTGVPLLGELYERTREKAREIRPNLIVLDPIAQLYGGNENDRYQVSHFINMVTGLAHEFDCGVLLPGHTAKAEGSEYSGCTAWNASVRSRLLLERKKGEENELFLRLPKGNYAGRPDVLSLHWVNGVLRPTAQKGMTMADKLEAEEQLGRARTAFLKALDQLTEQRRNVSHSERAANYAPKLMAGMCEGFSQKQLAAAMESLFEQLVIVANSPLWKGTDRKPVLGIARRVDAP